VTSEEQPASQRQRIDPYVGQYAERAVGMVASEIRALFAVAARPEIVSLAGGSPYVTARAGIRGRPCQAVMGLPRQSSIKIDENAGHCGHGRQFPRVSRLSGSGGFENRRGNGLLKKCLQRC
jgi:hypothetical protein